MQYKKIQRRITKFHIYWWDSWVILAYTEILPKIQACWTKVRSHDSELASGDRSKSADG